MSFFHGLSSIPGDSCDPSPGPKFTDLCSMEIDPELPSELRDLLLHADIPMSKFRVVSELMIKAVEHGRMEGRQDGVEAVLDDPTAYFPRGPFQ